jgi:uncharacterized damage-inducible protein DinB
MSLEKELIAEFKKRVFEESYSRIFKCLDLLSEEEVWFRPNSNCNSIGNLILHLHGNMRQWICTSFAQKEDVRMRSEEFIASNQVPKKELKKLLLDLKNEILSFVDELSSKDIIAEYKVQVFRENGVSILVHVIEHFSYHTGQIALLTKLMSDKDLEFYPFSLE